MIVGMYSRIANWLRASTEKGPSCSSRCTCGRFEQRLQAYRYLHSLRYVVNADVASSLTGVERGVTPQMHNSVCRHMIADTSQQTDPITAVLHACLLSSTSVPRPCFGVADLICRVLHSDHLRPHHWCEQKFPLHHEFTHVKEGLFV